MKVLKVGDEIHNMDDDAVFLWCLHCERTYRRGECREIDGLQMCPYEGCDGDTVLDGKPWNWARVEHPDYPTIPTEGQRYPLYSEKGVQ